MDSAQSLPQTLDNIYQYLVPDRFQANLQGVGVMGGISKGVSRMHQPTIPLLIIVVPSSFYPPDVLHPPMQHGRRSWQGCWREKD